jgi:putative ABC transport system permease protein
MIRNYLKIAFRNLQRNRSYTAINIFGLSVSLAVAIVLFKVISFELSFDNYHQNIAHIYQLISTDKYGEVGSHVPQGAVNSLKSKFPGVERATSLYNWTPLVVRVNNKNFNQQNSYFVQPEWLRMIDVKWVKGSPEVLGRPMQVVIDEPTAKRLFGNENAMGKTIRFHNKVDLTVSGIIKKAPANSQYQMEMLVSYETVKSIMPWYKNDDYWDGGDSYFHGYVQLKPGTNPATIEAGINKLTKEHAANSSYTSFKLVPMRVNHFDTHNDVYNYAMPKWLLYAWGSIGVFLLLIACINFINIATVQAFQRNKETGMRKILGSSKAQIITQFFTETGVLVMASVLIAAWLANWLLPYTGRLLNTHVSEIPFWSWDIILFLGTISLIVILFSGAYPAIVLSGFRPVQLLRSRFFTPASKGISLRQSLVVTQFVIAQVLVICTLIGTKQVKYLYTKDLGFDKASVLTANMPEPRDRILRDRLHRQLQSIPDVENVTFGLTTPSSRSSWWWTGVYHHGLQNGNQQWREQFIDTNYFSFFHIPVVAGRSFTATDSNQAVAMINEKAANDLGYKMAVQALGQQITINDEKYTVTGIVRDYVSQSLKSTVTPHVYFHNSFYESVIVRVKEGRQAQALRQIEKEWQAVFPEYYFSHTFLDEDLKEFYSNESKLANFVSVLAIIGILIGCLGVYGLVSFICIRKTKEIGIRKVLGASLSNILMLLSNEFMRLIAVAFIIATPLAWYLMNVFLQDYNYRIPIPWYIFLLSGAGALLITFITISFQAIKAALANPVKSLRTD